MRKIYTVEKNGDVLAVTTKRKLAYQIAQKFEAVVGINTNETTKLFLKPVYYIGMDNRGHVSKLFRYPSNDESPYFADKQYYEQSDGSLQMNIIADNIGQAIIIAKDIYKTHVQSKNQGEE